MEEDEIKELIAGLDIEISKTLGQNERILQIDYYEKMQMSADVSKYQFELDTLIVEKEQIDKDGNSTISIELYDSENNSVGKVINGKVYFDPQYLELMKENYPSIYDELIELNGMDYKKLVEKNKDRSFTMAEKEIDEHIQDERYMQEHGLQKEDKEDEKSKDEEKEEEEQEKNIDEKEDTTLKEKIAEEKGIPTHSIVFVKENSNLYKNHPELERNMYFYRDKDGIVKAEYLDKDGKAQPSKYINDSKTYVGSGSNEIVNTDRDGQNITKEVPYQFMSSSIKSTGDKVREIGFAVNISMGSLEIEEARLGTDGVWSSHPVELKGRDYNSQKVNERTDLMHKSTDPTRLSNTYDKFEGTEFADNGIQIDELRQNVNRFMDEGYQKKEAIQIVKYMLGDKRRRASSRRKC